MARAAHFTFSGEQLEVLDLARDQSDTEASVRSYFLAAGTSGVPRFAGYVENEVLTEMENLLAEHDRRSTLAVLSALEAAFRIDYLLRCEKRSKDAVSRALRDVFTQKEERASLEDDILGAWKDYSDVPSASSLVSKLRGALKYRHWLAHGRYWVPKLGQVYDFSGVYVLAEAILNDLPLFEPD